MDYSTDLQALHLSGLREAHSICLDMVASAYEFVQVDLPSLTILHGQLATFSGVSAPLLTAIEGDLVDLDLFSFEMSYYALFLANYCTSGAVVDLHSLGYLWMRAPVPTLPSLETVDGEATIYGVPGLSSFSAPVLRSVGELSVSGDELVSIAFPSLVEALGPATPSAVGVAIQENPVLQALDLSALATVAGPLTITDNPMLCRPLVDEIVAHVTATGFATKGNGADAACDPYVPPGPNDTGGAGQDTAAAPPAVPQGAPTTGEAGCSCMGGGGSAGWLGFALAAAGLVGRRRPPRRDLDARPGSRDSTASPASVQARSV